jgi:hypothetical protein
MPTTDGVNRLSGSSRFLHAHCSGHALRINGHEPPWWNTTAAQRTHGRDNHEEGRGQGRRSGNIRPLQPLRPIWRPDLHFGLPPFDEDGASTLREARAKRQPIPPFPDIPF